MKVPLKPGWEMKVSAIKPRVYSLGNNACQLVDKMFDEIHHVDRLMFMFEYTPFDFLIFVI